MSIDHTKMDKFVDGKLVKEGKKDSESLIGKHYWWKAETPEAMAEQIQGTIKFIATHQSTRIEQLTVGTRLYGSASPFNFIGPALQRSASFSGNSQSNRLSFNLCASVIDTLTSKVAKNKVIPMFVTSGGKWGMQKRAEQLSKFIQGMFYEHDIHTKGTYAFRDAGMWGDGLLKIFRDKDKVGVERSFPHLLLVDEKEALTGNPRQLHEVKIADRDIVMDAFKDLGEDVILAIKNAGAPSYIDLAAEGTAADLITISESWHLPSGEDAKDGLRAICVGDTCIFKEEWKKDYFPFPQIQYNKRALGFWGQGACERLQNLQTEINREMILIQRSHWMGGSFKVLVENGSKVVSQHLNNDVGAIIHYTGTPPQYVTPPIIQREVYEWVDSLIAKGYQQEGVSQLAANSMKPAGLDSGQALRTFDNIADDRFLFTMQNMETFYIEVARQMIEVVRDIYKEKRTYKVTFPQSKFVETIDWKDVKLEQDEYVLRAYPTSSLPDDPAGRRQTIQEYMQAGIISPRQGRRLMSEPDLEMSDKLANAAEDLICKVIEDMLEEGSKYRAPEPFWDLGLCRQIGLEYYNYAELNNCPDELLKNLRQFLSQVDDLTGVNQPQPSAPQPNQPMANPMPTPQSALLPNTPAGVA